MSIRCNGNVIAGSSTDMPTLRGLTVTGNELHQGTETHEGQANFGNVSVSGALNIMGVNLDDKINNAVGSKQDKYVGILGSSHTFDDNGVFLVQLNCSYANSQFYEVGIFVSSFDGQFPHYQRLFISPLVTDSFSIIQNGKTLLVNPYWGSAEQRNNSYWQVFKISRCYY